MAKTQTQIDPRGPRFGATITNVLSAIIFFEALDKSTEATGAVLFGIAAVLTGLTYTALWLRGWLTRSSAPPGRWSRP